MFVTHDYKCHSCGHYEYDVFIKRSDMHAFACPECGETMTIKPSAPKIDWDALARGDNASPEAIRHFERKRAQQKSKEEKSMREHGDRGRTPGA